MAKVETTRPDRNLRFVLYVVGAVTLAIAASGIHTFLTLTELRQNYLETRAMDISAGLQRGVRGPGRLTNPDLWESLFEESIADDQETIRFLGLVDSVGRVLAARPAGYLPSGASIAQLPQEGVFVHQEELPQRRGGPPWAGGSDHQRHLSLVVAVSTESTAFILRQAYLHAVVSLAAIVILWVLALYLVRTTHRLVQASLQEETERNLANLGRMAATLAHEIRNPLGAMKGLTQVIQEDLPADHSAQSHMATVVGEAERLENLVTDLLTFARTGRIRVTEFDPGEVVEDVVALLRPLAAGQEITFEIEAEHRPAIVRSDRDGFRQVLLNVLTNAVEASPQGGAVKVRLPAVEDSRRITVQVIDRGPGFPDSDPEEYFQPFKTTKLRGSGLGLPICRQILERLGGTIRLSHRPEGGACCEIQLPSTDRIEESATTS